MSDAQQKRLERILATARCARVGAELTVTEQRELAEAYDALVVKASEPVRTGSLWGPRDPDAKNPLDAIDTAAALGREAINGRILETPREAARRRVTERADAAGPPATSILAGSPVRRRRK